MAGGLANPWWVAFLPGGDMLVTEKPGRLGWSRRAGSGASRSAGVPEVYAHGQGGLFDVALDPGFAQNRTLYLSYAYADEAGRTTTRVTRARYAPEGLSEQRVILEAQPPIGSQLHFGGRLAFMPDGTLLLTMGERFAGGDLAQDLGTDLGKVLRVDRDGAAPADNPFVGREAPARDLHARAPQPAGTRGRPARRTVWEEEHGAMGGDEINRLRPGAQLRLAAGGVRGELRRQPDRPRRAAQGDRADPAYYWDPSIAPSGLALYLGDKFPGWKGDLLVGRAQVPAREPAAPRRGGSGRARGAVPQGRAGPHPRRARGAGRAGLPADRRGPGRPIPARASCRH